jgi:PiT family inorganic phosphate transporter
MAAGTAGGGYRIISTMGHKMVKLTPLNGFAAETVAACIISGASHIGMPVSTTHVISTSIMGVGATRRLSAVKWGIVGNILWAWVLTLPITAIVGYWIERALTVHQ